MSAPVYKVNKEIKVVYQAPGATTGLTVAMDVYDETQTLGTTADFNSSAMAEVGGSGRYRATFTPDAVGDWIVQMYDTGSGRGKVVKHYEIGDYDVDTLGDDIDNVATLAGTIQSKTDNLPVDPADQSLVEDAIDASEAAIISEIDDLESPAMVG